MEQGDNDLVDICQKFTPAEITIAQYDLTGPEAEFSTPSTFQNTLGSYLVKKGIKESQSLSLPFKASVLWLFFLYIFLILFNLKKSKQVITY